MARRNPLFAALMIGAVLAPDPLSGQATVEIPDRVSCDGCAITVDRIRELGAEAGPGFVGEPNSVIRNGRGRYLVSHLAGWNWFSVFDENGGFRRRVGREGAGPGEFNFIRMLRTGPADSVVAVDNALRRITLYSPELQVARIVPLPADPFDLEPLPDGRMVVSANIATRERIGFPLHILDDSGRVTLSFGTERPAYRRDVPGLTRRSLAVRDDGSLWAVHFSDYVIELWGADGALQRRWIRNADWFSSHPGRARIDIDEPPQPIIVDAVEDSRGLLWIMMWVADPDWSSAVRVQGYLQGKPRYTYTSADAYWDTLIEVFDPAENRIVVSHRVPVRWVSFVGEDEAASFRETERGAVIDVWRYSLITPARR